MLLYGYAQGLGSAARARITPLPFTWLMNAVCRGSASLCGQQTNPPRGIGIKPYGFSLVWSVIQLVSHVFPPSVEKACSKCGESVVTPDQINRA
jgi:hypothetical protein